MCDTIVVLGNVTADGVTLLGKNSNREANEAHHVICIPAARHAPNSKVKCTYIEIPQVEQTYAVLLAKPFWIWGAEMGANEHGVAIGNEAVFTKIPYGKEPGLIGMDFQRLALERARTAKQALDVITRLLAQYGQSGNCGFRHPLYYHNSFIIADPNEAWVLETAGEHWAAEKVQDVRTISNGITIGNQFDLSSPNLVNYAIEHGWCKGHDDFHFGRCYSDFIYTRFGRSNERHCRTTELLAAHKGKITVETMASVLRDHGSDADADWSPSRGLLTYTLCAHAGWGPVRGGAVQTTGSMIAHLARDVQTHFVTATAAPCTSIFKPVWVDANVPDTGTTPQGEYDAATLFWRHEALHRAALRDYATRHALYADERDAIEERFVQGALAHRTESIEERAAFSVRCFAEANDAERRWATQIRNAPIKSKNGFLYESAWRAFNQEAKMPAGG